MSTSSRAHAKPASRKPGAAAAAGDAVALLIADHKEVHALFQTYKKLVSRKAGAEERQPLAEQICLLLTVHTAVEEELFYPAARRAEVEHASAKGLIAQLRGMTGDEALYDAKVTVLGEYIDHHVKEEQDEMFPACRKSTMDLQALGEKMALRKEALTSEQMEGMEVEGSDPRDSGAHGDPATTPVAELDTPMHEPAHSAYSAPR